MSGTMLKNLAATLIGVVGVGMHAMFAQLSTATSGGNATLEGVISIAILAVAARAVGWVIGKLPAAA